MFSLDKLPEPLRVYVSGLPAAQLMKLYSHVSAIAGLKIEEVPTSTVREILKDLGIADGDRTEEVLTHMAANGNSTIVDWFSKAAQDGYVEKLLKPRMTVLHRCYQCQQPNEFAVGDDVREIDHVCFFCGESNYIILS